MSSQLFNLWLAGCGLLQAQGILEDSILDSGLVKQGWQNEFKSWSVNDKNNELNCVCNHVYRYTTILSTATQKWLQLIMALTRAGLQYFRNYHLSASFPSTFMKARDIGEKRP